MEYKGTDEISSREEPLKENLRIQKASYIREQTQKRRDAQDEILRQLEQEQQVIDELQTSIDENMERSEETRKYNQEFQQQLENQLYQLHGISEDRLKGMKEYRNAYYQGCAAMLFILSVLLTAFCIYLNGITSPIVLLLFACTAMEGALLAQEKKRVRLLDVLCRILYLLIFPAMLVMFILYELDWPEYSLFLPYMVGIGMILTVLGTVSYFLYNPYRGDKKKVRQARQQLQDIKKIAQKEVRRNQKTREKQEKRLEKRRERDERRARKKEKRRQRMQAFLSHFRRKQAPPQPSPESPATDTEPMETQIPEQEAALTDVSALEEKDSQ